MTPDFLYPVTFGQFSFLTTVYKCCVWIKMDLVTEEFWYQLEWIQYRISWLFSFKKEFEPNS